MSGTEELSLIEQAFAWRPPPQYYYTESSQLFEDEKAEVLFYQGQDWRSFTCAHLQKDFDLLSLITPDAYCYCLPGIMSAVIRENQRDLIIVESIIGCLDRPPNPDNWDDFFLSCWTRFTLEEYDAIEQWLWWLYKQNPDGWFLENDRICQSIDTLTLLRAPREKQLSLIGQAFGWRQPPLCYLASPQLSEDDKAKALSCQGKDWRSFTCLQLQRAHDLLSLLSPDAYCYCLPGIMSAVVRDNRPDLAMVDSILLCLDQSPNPDAWDGFFRNRWSKFTLEEYDAIEQWLWWLCECDPNGEATNAMLTIVCRCVDTLKRLRASRNNK